MLRDFSKALTSKARPLERLGSDPTVVTPTYTSASVDWWLPPPMTCVGRARVYFRVLGFGAGVFGSRESSWCLCQVRRSLGGTSANVIQADPADERTNFLVEEYSTSGRLDNVTQAAARHQCSYLISMHVDEFLKTGGIAEWLNGLEYVPQKLKNLNEINKLLAHRPWLITKEHIQKLVKTGENNWSLPELVHAVVLLAHYHALASFVFGSGINLERDPEISNGFKLIAVNNFGVCDLANDNNIENASLAGTNFGTELMCKTAVAS
nr:sestrin-3-like [Manis javanica]